MDLSLSQEINEWKLKYPFLEHIWSLFEDFSNELVDDENELYIVCDGIAAPYHGKISEYKEFCKILLKNLDRVSLSENKSESETGAGYFEDNMDDNTRCINLNRWLYYYTKIHHVPDEFIEEVFSAMDGLVTLWGDKFKYTKCYYESYSDVYAEPEDLIKLLTFVDNDDVIQRILMSEHSSLYYSCFNYINECAKIYRKLNTSHCNATENSDKKYVNLCRDLGVFKTSYTSEYKEFCKILLKNLDRVSLSENKSESETGAGYFEDNMDDNTRCINLNRWLYYYTKIHHVPDEFIEEVFSAMDGLVTLWGDKFKYTKCYYESYSDVYAEPEDLIKLLTFVDNEEVILNILMSKPSSVYYSCVDYMNECAKIYRKLNTSHCNATENSDKKYVNLCRDLGVFKTSYTSLYDIELLQGKVPHLDSPQLEHGAAESQIRDEQVPKTEDTDFLSNPLKSKITTAVTAGVGACGFLGFLYKVNRNYYIYRNITYLIFFILNYSDESFAFAYM
ncbi:VIR protein [Plasmodium vivax]|uniref:VIR protein n=1 Tax=Plasmodium vivax TaxID=5855 RepID=A0A1G4E699_PLAVI|nr:VIR protein [Plasmodium vivax]